MPSDLNLSNSKKKSSTSTTLTLIKPSSIRHRALDILRTAIIRGELSPGHRLIEEDVCKKLSISRGPVREALRQLEQEGLVISHPYTSTEVATISELEVKEVLMPIRITLEQFGFKHAVGLLTASDFAHLQGLVDRMHGAAQRADILEVNDLDVEFHETILTIAAQPHCLQLWRMILPRIRAYFYQWTAKDAAGLVKIAQQHQALLEVLSRRNLRAISSALKLHILETNPV